MRKAFEQNLQSYGESIKEKTGAKEELKALKKQAKMENRDLRDQYPDVEAIAKKADKKLESAAREQHTDKAVQERIYSLQEQKQQIMEHLQYDLACLDDPNCKFETLPGERATEYDKVDDTFTYEDDNHKKRSATFGEVITDMDFDIHYHLNKEDVPRNKVKQYLVTKAKKDLRELLDTQIIENETGNDNLDSRPRKAYKQIEKDRKAKIDKEKHGFISEKVVKNFLKQFAIDKNLPFKVEEVDVYQDVVQKMDFIVHILDGLYAYEVKTGAQVKDVAVQFSTEESKRDEKESQIARLEDRLKKDKEKIKGIALVIFSEMEIGELKKRWENDGRQAGGPGKYMSMELQKKLFHELLKDIYNEKDIDLLWDKAHSEVGFDENEYKMAA